MKILVYGAGVIGSIFAGKLALNGHDVTMLARGKRFLELQKNGVVLKTPGSDCEEAVKVRVIETLLPDDVYEYIFVVMQKTQVRSVLPALAGNQSQNIIFVVNTASGYAEWANAVGKDRLMLGFPSAGGERLNGQVNYFIGKGIMRAFQTTTFSDYSGDNTQRLKKLVNAFKHSGIPTVTCKNMDMWQKTHVAMVTSIGNALYKYGSDNYALSKSLKDVKQMVMGIKEGFKVLNKLNIKVTPAKLNYFKLPVCLVVPVFKVILGTKLAEITMAKHTAVAKAEMAFLQNEFDQLIYKSGLKTPAIDQLREFTPDKETTGNENTQ